MLVLKWLAGEFLFFVLWVDFAALSKARLCQDQLTTEYWVFSVGSVSVQRASNEQMHRSLGPTPFRKPHPPQCHYRSLRTYNLLFNCLSVCICVCVSVSVFVSVYLSVQNCFSFFINKTTVCQPICLSIYLSVWMSSYLSTWLLVCMHCLPACMSVCLSACLQVSMSACLYVYLYVCLSRFGSRSWASKRNAQSR